MRNIIIKVLIFVFFLFFSIKKIFAEISVNQTISDTLSKVNVPDIPNFGVMLFRMILALLFITILIYGLAFFMKKLSKGNRNSNSGITNEIVNIFQLNNKQSLYFVKIIDEIYILGISPENISLIDKISNLEKIDKLLENKQENFNDKFSNILKKFKEK